MSKTSNRITLLVAIIGSITGVLSLSWQIYTEIKNSKESLDITWGIYPTPIYRLLLRDNDQYDDSILVKTSNRSKANTYITSIYVRSASDDCPFNYRLTKIDETLDVILEWSPKIFIFEKSLPTCVDLYKDDVSMIVETNRGNVFYGSFNPILGAFNDEGKLFFDIKAN